MYSMAAVAFIVVAGGGAVYLSQRPTVAHGAVLAETVHDIPAYSGVTVTCDDAPITADGADFACTGTDSDGSYEDIACSLKPNGSFACKTTDEHRKARKPRDPRTGDVWK